MTAFLQISTNFSALDFPPQDCLRKQRLLGLKVSEPINIRSLSRRKIRLVCKYWLKTGVSERKLTFLRVNRIKDGTFIGEDGWKKSKRVVLVRFNGLGGGGGGGGGGGRRDNARVLGNLALAIGLIYLSVTGQLGWVLDAIVSVWLLAVLLPIVGLGAFLWWAGRDIVQGTCPNCGNVFQVFKSTLNDDLQLCPFCSQPFSADSLHYCEESSSPTYSAPPLPFSQQYITLLQGQLMCYLSVLVVGDKFVRDPVKFSNQSTTFEDAFNDFFPRAKKGKESSVSVVDVEAEVKDAE